MKLFEDQKDTIKLTSLVSNVVDADTQEKIDIVKSPADSRLRLQRRIGHRRAAIRRQHLRAGRCQVELERQTGWGLRTFNPRLLEPGAAPHCGTAVSNTAASERMSALLPPVRSIEPS